MRKVVGRYRVRADVSGLGGDYGRRHKFSSDAVVFDVDSSGYKRAWKKARDLCRTGGNVDFVRGDNVNTGRLEPGRFTVYRVDASPLVSYGSDSASEDAKMLISLPLELRERLKLVARRLGTDANTYAVSILAASVGWVPKE